MFIYPFACVGLLIKSTVDVSSSVSTSSTVKYVSSTMTPQMSSTASSPLRRERRCPSDAYVQELWDIAAIWLCGTTKKMKYYRIINKRDGKNEKTLSDPTRNNFVPCDVSRRLLSFYMQII